MLKTWIRPAVWLVFSLSSLGRAESVSPSQISYRLPTQPTVHRVTIAIVKADDPAWIVRTLLSGAVREATEANQGLFAETWDGLDEDGYPAKPGRYAWKGVYMPAKKWGIDGKYHTFTAKLAVAAGSSIVPGPNDDALPMTLQGVSILPVNDLWAVRDGKLLLFGEMIENGSNPLLLDPERKGAKQLVWGAPSGGVGAVNAGAADEDYAYAVSGAGGIDVITRYDMRTGARLPFGSERGTYLGDVFLLPRGADGRRETAVSMAALKTKTGKHYVYVPLLRAGRVLVLDGATGKRVAEIKGLVSPRGTRLDPGDPEAGLFVLCRGLAEQPGGFLIARIRLKEGLPDGPALRAAALEGLAEPSPARAAKAIDPVWSSERGPGGPDWSQAIGVWKSELQPALGLAVGRDGAFYVGNQIANQVWKYASSGKLLRKIGKEGGQLAGKFDPQAMRVPQGLDVRYDESGSGHLVVAERVVWQRVSQWSLDGGFERDWMIGAYGFPPAVDPERPEYVYVTGDWTGTVRYQVDYRNGNWKLDAVWPTQPGNPGDGLMYGNSTSPRMRIHHVRGRTFLAASSAQNSRYIYEVDGYRLVARAAIGSDMVKTFADRLGLNMKAFPVQSWGIPGGVGKSQDHYLAAWTWRDANGDGKEQAEEIDLSQPPVLPGRRDAVDVARAFRSYWGEYYDADLNLLLQEQGGARYAVLPRSGWDAAGNPLYSWKNLKILLTDTVMQAEGRTEGGYGAIAAAPEGGYYRTEFDGPPSPGGVDHGAAHSFAKLAKFLPDGKGGFRLAWRVGRHAGGVARPGEMYVPSQVSEPINGIVGVHDFNGLFHLFSTAGLYLDTLLNDRYAHAPPNTIYDLNGEMFGGRASYNENDGQAYLAQGHQAVSLFQIENLTTKGVVREIPNSSPPFTLLASQIAPASNYALERQGTRKLTVVGAAHGGAPDLDGSPRGWSASHPISFPLDADHQIEARVLYDPEHLYLRCHVRLGRPPRPTTLGNLSRCFTHEAKTDVLGFYIQGDPDADPARTTPAPGDVRFLLTLAFDPDGKVKPVVAAMYGSYPGGGRPVNYASPIGTAKFDEVRISPGARTGWQADKDGQGFTIAAAIPLNEIPILAPRKGLVTGINFDAVLASGVRRWWSNAGADPAANLMSDEFSEARIYPHIWGQAQFADPSRLTVAQWSVVGPFGGPDVAKKGDDPLYVLRQLAATTYPPEKSADVDAVYEGDLTRTWRGKTGKLAWRQVECDQAGWVRLDRAFQLGGDDSRGAAYAVVWVHAPHPVKVALDVEGRGIVWTQRLWLNGREAARQAMPERGPEQFRITPGQKIELAAGWNQILLRVDSWAHDWNFDLVGGWSYRLTLGDGDKDLWSLKFATVPPSKTPEQRIFPGTFPTESARPRTRSGAGR